MRERLASELQTILRADVTALRIWLEKQKAVAEDHAEDPRVRGLVLKLLEASRGAEDPRAALLASPALAELRRMLEHDLDLYGYGGFGVLDRNGRFLANQEETRVGLVARVGEGLLGRALAGETMVTRPIRLDFEGAPDETVVGLLAAAPLRDESGQIVAIVGFRINVDGEFTRILSVARMGETGGTYAFDRQGLLVSASRFEAQLREIGLLPRDPAVKSFMNIEVRDPGGSLVEGYVPGLPLKARPLTRMAADAVTGRSGVDVDGYRDYRGVRVAGAWTWLPELEIGIATEIDIQEAYAGLFALEGRFYVLIGLLVLGALAGFFYSAILVRLRNRVAEVRELGRYRIEKKIGGGGVGAVYLASHAMLRRPTAVKLLRLDRSSGENLARFEREVQVSSGLTHPNTIEIYDYGHTPEGLFYYAMEYVDGMTLSTCVEEDGTQPEARVDHLMKQACGSIAEAHARGLIHRDIKPGNIMLCERGGLFDFVKVLDFGLVRAEEQRRDAALTDIKSLTGTPLYLSPEAIQAPERVDVRSDVYQLGGIAYFLLVGRHVFSGDSIYEVLAQHVGSDPEPPSAVLGRAVSPDLERIILRCLAKKAEERPANAAELLQAFEQCEVSGEWGQRQARDWWTLWRARHPDAAEPTDEPSTPSHPSGYSVDIDEKLQPERPPQS